MSTKTNLCAAIAAVTVIASVFSVAVLLAQLQPVDISTPFATINGESPKNTSASVTPQRMLEEARAQGAQKTVHAAAHGGDVTSASSEPSTNHLSVNAPSFNAEAIFEATQKVRVDEQGQVVLDHEALMLLERTLGQRDLHMDDAALTQLKELVEFALPGAGAQVAAIVGDYYEFLRAKDAYEEQAFEAGQADDYDDRQRHLQLLRETYLGAEVADKLFAETDAQTALLRANMLLAADTALSEESRQQQQYQIHQQYVERVLRANGWAERYGQFLQDKAVLAKNDHARSDTPEKNTAENNNRKADNITTRERAIAQLWQSHFSEAEREKMLSLQIPVFEQQDD